MSAEAILAELVAIPSVCRTPNHAIIDYVRSFLQKHKVDCTILPGPEGDRSNLFASVGPRERPGYILSAHLDVVPAPAEGWSSDPFRLRQDGDRLHGRGAVDMKGFIACVLSNVPFLTAVQLKTPVHIALSYDEEVGCVGVRHLIEKIPTLCAPPLGCIVGEPTMMSPVLRHKGKIAQRVIVQGKAGHSSRPDLAVNAIHHAAELILSIRDQAARLTKHGPFDARFAPSYSSLQVGVVSGGTNVNVVPDRCQFDVEARAIPGTDPQRVTSFLAKRVTSMLAKARQSHDDLDIEIQTLSSYPPLNLSDDHPLAALTEELSCQKRQAAVSFGTEAGLYHAAGIPSVVCGPGDVTRAHKTDEFITKREIADGAAMIVRLIEHSQV